MIDNPQGSEIAPNVHPARFVESMTNAKTLLAPWVSLAIGSFLIFHYRLEPNARLQLLVPLVAAIAAFLSFSKVRTQGIILAIATVVFVLTLCGPYIALVAVAVVLIACWDPFLIRMPLWLKSLTWVGCMASPLLARHNGWIDGYAAMFLGGVMLFSLPMTRRTNRTPLHPIGLRLDRSLRFLPLPAITMPLFGAIQGQFGLGPRVTARLTRIGSKRILEGILLLLVYRLIYSVLHIPATEVDGPYSLGIHWLTNTALLIRLAGFVRLSIGLLNLLGYASALPSARTSLRSGTLLGYLNLLNSPLVRWMNRVVFRPLQQIAKEKGVSSAVFSAGIPWVGTGMVAMLIHTFFWYLRFGHLQLRWVDLLFWSTLVTILFFERAFDRYLPRRSHHGMLVTLLPTCFTILVGLPAFSLVTSHSLENWMTILASGIAQFRDAALTFTIVLPPAILILWSIKHLKAEHWARLMNLALMVGCLTFMALAVPQVRHLALRSEPRSLYLTKPGPSRSDDLAMAGGYYAEIIDSRSDNRSDPSESLEIKEKFAYTKGAEKVPDFRRITQKRSFSFTFKGHPYTTNSMGFRDREYRVTPAPNTVRTLLLGSSFVAGSGVRDEEVFDVLLETSMNRSNTETQFEFLNASCSIYDLIDCIVRFDKDSLAQLKPDYLMIFSHGLDRPKNVRDVVEAKLGGYAMPYPYIDSILLKAGIHDRMSESEAIQALRPYGTQLVRESYRLLAEKCLLNGIEPIWVYWPCMIMLEGYEQDYKASLKMVTELGYNVIDLEKVYKDFDPSDLIVAANDHHPNNLGHLLVAKALAKHFHQGLELQDRR